MKSQASKRQKFCDKWFIQHALLCGQNGLQSQPFQKMKTLGEKKIGQKWHGNYSL